MNKYKYLALGLWMTASFAGAATMTVSPSSGTYTSGGTFSVNVVLDTTGAQIDGVDVRYLRFNPSVLQVVDANANTSGVQVTPGTLMPSTLSNSVDNTNGLVTFSQIVPGGQKYSGSGTLLTINFRAVSGGTATLSFDAVSGRTTDSNVASAGSDVLTTASGATFTITGAVTATPSPTPTGTAGGLVDPNPVPNTTPVATTPVPTTVNGVPGIILTRTLSVGSTGADVTTLQNFLIAGGYLAPGNAIGFYGKMTRAAVQKYQCAKMSICSGSEGVNGYGMVGARTRAALAGGTPATTPTTPSTGTLALTRTVYIGARGTDITSLQNVLIAKGYLNAGSNSGYFGALTKAAVQKFQCEKMGICSGTEATTGYGMVGARTRASLSQ